MSLRWCSALPVIMVFCLMPGCAGNTDDEWTPWYDWRGAVRLTLKIAVKSHPDGAQVFLDGEFQGTTPLVLDVEVPADVRGQGRDMRSLDEQGLRVQIVNTRFVNEHPLEIRLVKEGYKPVARSLVIEDYFSPDALEHNKHYRRTLEMDVGLKKYCWLRRLWH